MFSWWMMFSWWKVLDDELFVSFPIYKVYTVWCWLCFMLEWPTASKLDPRIPGSFHSTVIPLLFYDVVNYTSLINALTNNRLSYLNCLLTLWFTKETFRKASGGILQGVWFSASANCLTFDSQGGSNIKSRGIHSYLLSIF